MITSFDLLGRRIMQRQEQLARNSLRTIISYSVHLILLDNYSGCQGYCADEASILVQKRNNHCCHILLDSDDGIRHAIRYFHYHTGCRIYNDHCDPARQTCFQLSLNCTLKYSFMKIQEKEM
jgi:hypothetical protein